MPGYTQTNRLVKLVEGNPAMANVVSEVPLGRFGKPEEFAAAVSFLASERPVTSLGCPWPWMVVG